MLKKYLESYIRENKVDILIVITLLLIGLVIGAGIYFCVRDNVKLEAIDSIKQVLDISKEETYVKTNIILNGVKRDLLLIGILTILSVTLFGKWIIYFITVLKGVSIYIYVTLLFNIFGVWWGLLINLLLVILVNLIYIPAFIYLIVNYLVVNFNIFKAKVNAGSIYKTVLSVLSSFVLMISSNVIEQIASTVVLNIYSKL